jgi:hypothetical protein
MKNKIMNGVQGLPMAAESNTENNREKVNAAKMGVLRLLRLLAAIPLSLIPGFARQAGLPRRSPESFRDEGGSRSVKVNQTDVKSC